MNKHIWTDKSLRTTTAVDKRNVERRDINVPARLTWKDQRGVQRFASVVTRNVSQFGVYVECQSAVYRVAPGTTSGRPQCLALRLMVDPRQQMADLAPDAEADRATA